MSQAQKHEQLKTTRAICLENAEAFLSVAERELDHNVDHICFHLALLALEEIGKSILATVSYMTDMAESGDGIGDATEDHVKKIFWALWGGGLLRNAQLTREAIDQNRFLAKRLHERRLESLYTDTRNPLPVSTRVEPGEARTLVDLTRARLHLEQSTGFADFEEGDVEEIRWFFTAVEDVEKRKQIFSTASLNKLAELKSGKEWIRWLHELYRKNDAAMLSYAQKELRRTKPEGEEAFVPKYRMRVRITTPSHSVRNNAFAEWNEGIDDIKLYKSDRKDVTKLSKGEILIDLILPKGLHLANVWDHGLFMAKTVVVALNVGTFGVFWWNVQKDVARYYEEIVDLEADPKGGVKLVVAPDKRLVVGFDEAKWVLDDRAMRNVNHIAAFFMRESKRLEEFLRGYATALTLFSKTDIHLRLEVNAFEEFYGALKAAMKLFGDWDGSGEFREAAEKQFQGGAERASLREVLDLGAAVDADVKREKHHPVTLTEVMGVKMYCDAYMQRKAKEYFEKVEEGEA